MVRQSLLPSVTRRSLCYWCLGFLVVVGVLFRIPDLLDNLKLNLGVRYLVRGVIQNDLDAQASAQYWLTGLERNSAKRNLAVLYQSRQDWDGAIDILTGGIEPSQLADPLSAYFVGLSYWHSGQRDMALSVWRAFFDGQFFIRRGDKARLEGDIEAAEQFYQAAGAIGKLVLLYYQQGDLERAYQLYSQTLDDDSASLLTRYWLIRIHYELYHQDQIALRDIDNLLSMGVNGEGVLELMMFKGVILSRGGDIPGAQAAWEAAAERFPRSASPLNLLGNLYTGAGQYDMAEQTLEQAIKLEPKGSEAHYLLGRLWLAQDRLGLAAEHFQAALELSPNYYWWYWEWASALEIAGDVCGAMTVYQRALQIFPNDAELIRWMQELDASNCPGQ